MTCELCFYSVRFRVVCVFRGYPLKTKEFHHRPPSSPKNDVDNTQALHVFLCLPSPVPLFTKERRGRHASAPRLPVPPLAGPPLHQRTTWTTRKRSPLSCASHRRSPLWNNLREPIPPSRETSRTAAPSSSDPSASPPHHPPHSASGNSPYPHNAPPRPQPSEESHPRKNHDETG